MKRIVSCILIILMIGTAFAGCGFLNGTYKTQTASESLEKLFTTIDLMDATVGELQAEMKEGNLTSKQLTQMYINRIEAYDTKLNLNSIIKVNPNALKEAEKLDSERKNGKVRGALHGIPIVVKANYDVAGMATSAGAKALADMTAAEDSFAVKKLRKAGAVILAQTNMSEFAYSSITSRSTLGGNVHNAYDVTKTPGGSSGGSAVAVTCNFAAAGIGTDTGGSIRNPASFSNLYAIRPSKGLTSTSGIMPLAAYRDTAAPIARTAEDTALLLETMAGTDKGDDYTVEADADKLLGSGFTSDLSADALRGMRIGYLEYSFSYKTAKKQDEPDEKIKKMLDKTLSVFTESGAELVDISNHLTTKEIEKLTSNIKTETFEYDINRYLSEKGDAAKYKTLKELITSESDGEGHMNLRKQVNNPDKLADSFEETDNPYTKKIGSYQRIPNWQKELDGRAFVAKIMKKYDIDAVVYLNYFDVAEDEDALFINSSYNRADYGMAFGPLLGLPEISVPMGFSDTDSEDMSALPLGLSVFADFGGENKLMNIAYAYEKQAGENIRRMPEQTPALEDKGLNAFLNELIDKASYVENSRQNNVNEKVRTLTYAREKAEQTDTLDPYATYAAAKELAEAYDSVIADIEQ